MYKLCKTEQSAQRQRILEEGLLQAMATCHYEEISVSDLCDRMNVPRKSFYRYFSGKDGALHALIDHTLMRFETGQFWFSARETQGFHGELIRFFCFWKAQKTLLDALARSGLSGVLVQRAIDFVLSEAGFRRLHGLVGPGDTEYGIMFVICGLMSMTVQWHHSGYEAPVEQMAGVAVRVLTRPLFDGA